MNGDNEQYFFELFLFMSQIVEIFVVFDDCLCGLFWDYVYCEFVYDVLVVEFGILLDDLEDLFWCEWLVGYFIVSCWLVSVDEQCLLLIYYCKLQCWLQLGGYVDGDCDLVWVVLKEVEEEFGLSGLVLEDLVIFDLDKYWILECKDVLGYWYYDVCFVIWVLGGEVFVFSEELLDLVWWLVIEVVVDLELDELMQCMVCCWLVCQ